MAYDYSKQEQDQNTAKLVMTAFHKVSRDRDGVTPGDITRYLQDKFGDVWRTNKLTSKAEATLNRSVVLGFLYRQGNRYLANLGRQISCRRRRRRRYCPRRRRRRSCRRRRRRCR